MKRTVCLILWLPIIAIACKHHQQTANNRSYSSWQLVWEDAFEGDSLNRENWNIIERNTADWGNYMSDCVECIAVKDGQLYLRGLVNHSQPQDTARYLTGGVDTKGKMAFRYGRIEIRAKLENATGAWPAIWMLADQPKYGAYPRNGEIDIMEHLNFEQRVFQTVHSYYTLVLEETENPPYYDTATVDPEQYNTYGLQWYPGKLVFTLNGQKTFEYPRLQETDSTQWPFDQPFYLMIDMQLGGEWVGQIDPDELPVQMVVDWVRLYKRRDE